MAKLKRGGRSRTLRKNKYINLVRDAVDDLEKGQGVSRQKILDYAMKTCKRRGKNLANSVKMAIIEALDAGLLQRTTGSGLNGSFRLSEDPSGCSLVSFTTTNEIHINEPCRRSQRLQTNNIIHETSGTINQHFHLKAILKAPRSKKSSGFHVRFSRSPCQIRLISPLPSRKRRRRCAE